jgi:hypothetical protein
MKHKTMHFAKCLAPGCRADQHYVLRALSLPYCAFHRSFVLKGDPIPPVPSEEEIGSARSALKRDVQNDAFPKDGSDADRMRTWLTGQGLHMGFYPRLYSVLAKYRQECISLPPISPTALDHLEHAYTAKDTSLEEFLGDRNDAEAARLRLNATRRIARELSGHVYFISNGEIGKVGTSTSLHPRLKTYRAHGASVRLLGATRWGGRVLEREGHLALRTYSVKGMAEWFRLDAVRALLTQWKQAAPHAFLDAVDWD